MIMPTREAPRKYLIVGNLGYIGSVLVKHLRAKYPDTVLIGFDIGYFTGCIFDPIETSDYLLDRQIYGDVRTFNASVLDGVDHVFYLAAISNDPMGDSFKEVTRSVNALCAANIADMAKARGVRSFVFSSSCSVYGVGGSETKNENSEVYPLTEYAKSKLEGENLLREIASDDFSVTCLRFATACGASPRLRLDLVLNDFVVSGLINKRIDILSDGTPWRPLVSIDTMCEAFDWASRRSAETGGNFLTLNAGLDHWNFQIRDLADLVQSLIPGVAVSLNSNASADKRSYRVSFSKYAQLTGNDKKDCSIEKTIQDMIQLVKQSEFRDPKFRESDFIRLHFLNRLIGRGDLTKELVLVKK